MYGITFVSIACKDLKVSIGYVLILAFIDRAKRGKLNWTEFELTESKWLKKWSKIKGKSDFVQVSGGSSQWGVLYAYLFSYFI